jgi:hypothetical protein
VCCKIGWEFGRLATCPLFGSVNSEDQLIFPATISAENQDGWLRTSEAESRDNTERSAGEVRRISAWLRITEKGKLATCKPVQCNMQGLLERVVASCEYRVGHDRLHVPTSDVAASHSLNISQAMTQFLDCRWNCV